MKWAVIIFLVLVAGCVQQAAEPAPTTTFEIPTTIKYVLTTSSLAQTTSTTDPETFDKKQIQDVKDHAEVAIETKNIRVCKQIPDNRMVDACIKEVALALVDDRFCESIYVRELRNRCVAEVRKEIEKPTSTTSSTSTTSLKSTTTSTLPKDVECFNEGDCPDEYNKYACMDGDVYKINYYFRCKNGMCEKNYRQDLFDVCKSGQACVRGEKFCQSNITKTNVTKYDEKIRPFDDEIEDYLELNSHCVNYFKKSYYKNIENMPVKLSDDSLMPLLVVEGEYGRLYDYKTLTVEKTKRMLERVSNCTLKDPYP